LDPSYSGAVIPEPTTLVLWPGLGAVGLIAAWRRRRHAEWN
jgi:MYXO-CTERM domain-containing protein